MSLVPQFLVFVLLLLVHQPVDVDLGQESGAFAALVHLQRFLEISDSEITHILAIPKLIFFI